MVDHPVTVIQHPIASKTKTEIAVLAQSSISEIVQALQLPDREATP